MLPDLMRFTLDSDLYQEMTTREAGRYTRRERDKERVSEEDKGKVE